MIEKKTLIVNLLGGPGAGKSTTAAGLFYNLKMNGYDCELVREFAKTITWEENDTALKNQLYITAQQEYKQSIVIGKVDVIITDSPIILGLFYYNEKDTVIRNAFETFIIQSFKRQNNLNIVVERKKKYNPNGRNQTEKEAKEIDTKTVEFLKANSIDYTPFPGTPEGLDQMYNHIIMNLKK